MTGNRDPIFTPSDGESPFDRLGTAARSIADLNQLSPAALAYLGDAVYELYIRSHYLFPPKRQKIYHHKVVEQVRAEAQARHLQFLEPYLSSSELEIVRRGRNATFGKPKRIHPTIYRQATSLETLVGYLYLSDPLRLTELLGKLDLEPLGSEPDTKSQD